MNGCIGYIIILKNEKQFMFLILACLFYHHACGRRSFYGNEIQAAKPALGLARRSLFIREGHVGGQTSARTE